jgi:signal transduction histidine kinase
MPFERTEKRTRTLRFRLMMWNAIVVIVTGLVTLIGLREGVRITLLRELDELLLEDLKEIQLSLAEFRSAQSHALREQLDRKSQGHSQHRWFAQLINREGEVLYSSSNAPAAKTLAGLGKDNSATTIQQWRVLTQLSDGPAQILIRVGASLEFIQADVARIDRLVAVAGGVILLLAPACGYWLAGRATRPLALIINTMDELHPSNLEERLPIRGTGDELDRLSMTFNGLLDRIGTYLQDKRDFLANAAHELRTPITAIRSSVEVTLASERTAAEYEEQLREILEESASLSSLVNQLLLLSESGVEALKAHHEQVPLDDLLDKALDMFGGLAESRDVQLTCAQNTPLRVEGNSQHLRQVLYNLIDNAIKFTPPGGRVVTELRLDDSEQQALFRIQDSGCGIPAEDVAHVFDRFFRGDRTHRRDLETRGTGLGLSICRAIVEGHGGSIRIDSTLGVGTTVVVLLPLRTGFSTSDLPSAKNILAHS